MALSRLFQRPFGSSSADAGPSGPFAASPSRSKKAFCAAANCSCSSARKADRQRTARPGRHALVDGLALRLGDPDPRIAVGRMQPAAAEIERVARAVVDAVGAAAEPRPRLDNQAVDRGHAEPPPRRDAGRAAANDRNLGVAIGHSGCLRECRAIEGHDADSTPHAPARPSRQLLLPKQSPFDNQGAVYRLPNNYLSAGRFAA